MSERAHGADFSSAQTLEEVVQVARHVDFAFVKASEGGDYVNPLLHSTAHALKTAGVLVGYYHFLAPGPGGADQWDHFEAALGPLRGPVCLDWEAKGTTVVQARDFIARGRQRGYRVGVYGSAPTCHRPLGQAWRWIASWGTTPPRAPWDVWQFTSSDNRQDYNVFNGDKAKLARWWKKHTAKTPQLRWWLHEGARTKGPYRLAAGVAAAFVAYVHGRPGRRTVTLERK